MINIDEIDKAILDLENHDTTFATCEKLAWLYTVRDHLTGSTLPKFTAGSSESEFCKAACSCDPSTLMIILEEHFEAVKALYPKEFAAIMQKIKSVV